jgi:predicted metalloendopeptidase
MGPPLIVGQPEFFKAANDLFKTVSIDDWKTYLRWHLIHDAAPELSSDFVNENFKFFGTALTGTTQLKPRWKRVVTSTDDAVGEAPAILPTMRRRIDTAQETIRTQKT